MKHITVPYSPETARSLRAGDEVLLTGTLYTARDAAHRRLCALIEEGKPLPVDLEGQVLYFTGPSPPKPGSVTGSAGPTTSVRMDAYSPLLIRKAGILGMIGKGGRTEGVIQAMREYGCVYFAAVGGAGALIARSITGMEVVCYGDLGPEAVHRLTVRDFPAIVAIDTEGGNLYRSGPEKYKKSI